MTTGDETPARPAREGALRAQGAMAELGHDELVAAQRETLARARRPYGYAARALFGLLDAVYGKERSLSKFRVLELVARVPYQSWEQVAYIAITHTHRRTDLARRIFEQVTRSRSQADNEQWHLLILEEMIAASGVEEPALTSAVVPQVLAFVYSQLSFLLYVARPAWSYRLNADFEDHAEHEYALLVEEHPEWEEQLFTSAFAEDYGRFSSVADLFRQISYDEHIHLHESIAAMAAPRFS